jgi:hypothetical protein
MPVVQLPFTSNRDSNVIFRDESRPKGMNR